MVSALDAVRHAHVHFGHDACRGVASMNKNKINIGKIRGWAEVKGAVLAPWWASCPVCPIHIGFLTVGTHGEAIRWTDNHLAKLHGPKNYVEGNDNAA